MVREWARLVAAEAETGATEEVYGVALVWQRAGAGAAPCDELTVSLAGSAWGTACAGGERRFAAQLEPARMAQLYRWVDELAPLQAAGAAGDPEGRPERLLLAGAGKRPAGDGERRSIQGFAEALHADLSAPRQAAFRTPEPPPVAYPEQPPPRPRLRPNLPAAPPPAGPPATTEPPSAIQITPATTEPP
jgi:hypothetical protein